MSSKCFSYILACNTAYVAVHIMVVLILRLVSEAWKPRLVSADSESESTAVSGRTLKEGHGLCPRIDRLRLGKVRPPRWDLVHAGQRCEEKEGGPRCRRGGNIVYGLEELGREKVALECGLEIVFELNPNNGRAGKKNSVVPTSATTTYPDTLTLERSDWRSLLCSIPNAYDHRLSAKFLWLLRSEDDIRLMATEFRNKPEANTVYQARTPEEREVWDWRCTLKRAFFNKSSVLQAGKEVRRFGPKSLNEEEVAAMNKLFIQMESATVSRVVIKAKKPRLFGFGTKAKAKPRDNCWLGLRFCQAKAKKYANPPPKAMAFWL
ncbi:hypothetical protein B0H14DRAFT_3157643 [Mycena olivaceomarginata]|nr:hypothetical protein B0H14DRAFT_3157643 [Mycena olivaceomarginata]